MSEEKNLPILTALSSAMPVLLVLMSETVLQTKPFVSHFALAVLGAQCLTQIVFLLGEICPGQRGRLKAVNLIWLGFWGGLLLLSMKTANYSTGIMSVLGFLFTLSTVCQSNDPLKRNRILLMGLMAGGAALLCYLFCLMMVESEQIIRFNLISQLITGVILAYLSLVISRNRLQGFIALLPQIGALLLLLNVFVMFAWTAYLYFGRNAVLSTDLAIYFVLHLILITIFAIPIWRKTRLNYSTLIFTLALSLCLPVLS